jgi:gamma-glutamyltranspeptidase/glutathione hydrolase
MQDDQSHFDSRWQARSVVVSRDGIVAAESPLAAQAGSVVLAKGGHAVDAAVVANAVMGVVAPHSNGIGGDLFAIVYEAGSGALYGLNASGWAPAALSIYGLKKEGISEMPLAGIHTVTVPGTVDGWEKLLVRFGRIDLAAAMAPAIHFAEVGFPVTEWSASQWSASESLLRADTNAARTFLPNGRAPRFGETFKNPDLAESLRRISAGGRDEFYKGDIANRIVEASTKHGGVMTALDLADFSSEWVDPISTNYRGWTIYELPPNGSGLAALLMLNIVENFPLGDLGHNSADSLHLLIEAKKLAYADMLRYVCDPRHGKVPIVELLSKDYARKRASQIDIAKAADAAEPCEVLPGNDTIYLSVVDRDGNMASLIQSNFMHFGSGLVPEGTGFALQNRGNLFSLDSSSANALEGGKRPLHTIIPGFMSKDHIQIAFGIMGGWNQSQAHAQFVSNIVDHGMNIQAALEAPRFTKQTFQGRDLQMETRVHQEARDELATRGHKVEAVGIYSNLLGGGQAVMRDYSAGTNYGASDPRKDGEAIPEPWLGP